MSQHETIENPQGGAEGAAQGTRRDPFGLNLPRRPDWELFGVVSDDLDLERDVAAGAAVELRRSGLVAGVVGLASAGLAVAWLSRAAADGGVLAWSLTAFLAVVALAYLTAFVDARVPLAVVDAQGVRMRLGRTWQGLPWESVDRVELAPRQGLLRDGRLVVVPFDADEVVGALDGSARWHAFLARRWYGGSFALPVGLSTKVTGADDLAEAVRTLADPEVPVQVLAVPVEAPDDAASGDAPDETPAETPAGVAAAEPIAPVAPVASVAPVGPVDEEPTAVDEPRDHEKVDTPSPVVVAAQRLRPWAATVLARLAERREARRERAAEPDDLPSELHEDLPDDLQHVPHDTPVAAPASPTPAPLREPRAAVRAEVLRREEAVLDLPASARVADPEPEPSEPSGPSGLPEAAAYLRRPDEPGLAAYETREEATGPLGVAASEPEPVVEPVVGPVLTEARRRLGLSVDQVAERTRIRPHVIEAIEVDDFGPCGGDFYARGHLRTLGRVLGVEPQPLVEEYDERYATAPVDARRVFEAELATVPGGSLRATRGGPNWSVLVAAVMSVVLLWAVAQFLFERPAGNEGTGAEQAGLTSGSAATPLDVELVAGEQAADVTVRDAAGEVVWQGRLEPGATQALRATPPVRISSSDGAVAASVDGRDASPLGEAGEPVQRSLS